MTSHGRYSSAISFGTTTTPLAGRPGELSLLHRNPLAGAWNCPERRAIGRGPLYVSVMFGLGGIFVEIFKDVSFRVAPITSEDAKEMISEVKSYPLLKGYRNTPPADLKAIIKILLNTSKLVMDNPEIKELDLNPIIVYEKGAKTVDARIILE
jgi:acyl-CoA synthetase (NDP forming)